jgi:hypothetical protein
MTPNTRQQIRESLETAGFCWIWIPNYSLLAKPYYEATEGESRNPWHGEKSKEKNL